MRKLIGGKVMKLTDMFISCIVKKGVLHEARNIDTEIEVPVTIGDQENTIKIKIKCEHMTLRVEKGENN
jgi:hypothetical protein